MTVPQQYLIPLLLRAVQLVAEVVRYWEKVLAVKYLVLLHSSIPVLT
jgi:hypothetical protein